MPDISPAAQRDALLEVCRYALRELGNGWQGAALARAALTSAVEEIDKLNAPEKPMPALVYWHDDPQDKERVMLEIERRRDRVRD